MRKLMQLLACSAIAWAGWSHAASSFSVVPGNWVVTAEIDGKAGRGMGIEVRDTVLVMTVYNYKSTGAATFHLSVGNLSGNQYSGPLLAYKSGRSLGSTARDAVPDGSAGEVKLQFSSATTGTIQFPGESALPMSHFAFGNIPAGKFARAGADESWFLTELDATNQPVSAAWLSTLVDNTGQLYTTSSLDACQTNAGVARCSVIWGTGADSTATLEMQRAGSQLDGFITKAATPGTKNRLIGTRLYTLYAGGTRIIADTPKENDLMQTGFRPEGGMWVISAENTGKPGRGMTIETQLDTLVVQLYGYNADGSSTFHIGAGAFKDGAGTVVLNKARGGRYYGSGAMSGSYVGNDGEAQLKFTSPTTGSILLPGEPGWKEMQKLPVGYLAPDPRGLLGTWSVLTQKQDGTLTSSKWNLTQVKDGAATDSGGSRSCKYETTPQGTVRCTDKFTITGRGTVYQSDLRFIPAYGAGASKAYSMHITPQGAIDNQNPDTATVQRITDGSGVMVGLKSQASEADPFDKDRSDDLLD